MIEQIKNTEIEISCIANAGIYIKSAAATFLIDAIHHEGDYPFSKVPFDTLAAMTRGQGPYANADYLLFTHTHPDHFTPGEVVCYLRNNRCKALLLQKDQTERTDPVFAVCQEQRIPSVPLSVAFGEVQHFSLKKDVELISLAAHHLNEEYAAVVCNCLLVQIYGKRILFLADADHGRSDEFSCLDRPVDMVFVNPYCLAQPAGRALLKSIGLKQLVVYHVPFVHDDKLGIRKLTKRLLERYQCEYGFMIALLDPSVRICL